MLGLLVLLPVLLLALPAAGQLSGVRMDIKREFLGLGGIVQRGTWTPVRVDLFNTSADNIEVTCRWLLTDEDGDRLIAQRQQITLAPNREQGVWLYANPPMSTRPGDTWAFQVVSSEGELLDQAEVQLSDQTLIDAATNPVGLCGFKSLGLNPWQRWSTTHERIQLVRGLNLETLPDRWYGMDGINALVWFPIEGGEPTSNAMSDASRRALREWVYRGGHLVLVLPYAGQQWTSVDSGLSDLLGPLKAGDMKQVSARPPLQVFGMLTNANDVPMLTFDLSDAPQYTTLAEVQVAGPGPNAQPTLEPMIVGRRFGFGQVTLVGIDLSDTSVLQSLDSFRMHRVWTRIFSWRASKTGELLPPSEFDNPQTGDQYTEARNAMNRAELGSWIGSRVARQRETGPAIGLAFILFILYAVAAAMTFPTMLRKRNWDRHSWVLFVGIVLLFSVVSWGGAWMMRPSTNSASHFTVLDIDGNTNVARARSWQSVLVPKFTTAQISVDSEAEGFDRMDVVNLLASPGHDLRPETPGYPDRRTYAYNAAQPNQIDVPMRSTTKSMVVDYLGQITARQPGLDQPWTLPNASLRIANNGLPAGTITHRFPDTLHDVSIIYCPGGAQTPGLPTAVRPDGRPLVYNYRNANNLSEWEPDQPIALPNAPGAYQALWLRPKLGVNGREYKNEGFLGTQVQQRGFTDFSTGGDSTIVHDAALMSFFDALPPPKYENSTLGATFGVSGMSTYHRSLVRDLDLTHLITGRRIIIIGHLKNVACPIPMTIDGENVDSEGWTVVRWIYDL